MFQFHIPFFADLYQSEYFTGGSIMQRAAWAILFLDQREREVFIIPSLERIQGAEFDGWDPTPSPKSLLRLQEHIHCVSSGVWKVNKIVWKPDIIQNLGGRESNIKTFFFFFLTKLWLVCQIMMGNVLTACLLEVDDVSSEVTKMSDMDEYI